MTDQPDDDTKYRIRSGERIEIPSPRNRDSSQPPRRDAAPARFASGSVPEMSPPELPAVARSHTARLGDERVLVEDHGDRIELVLADGTRLSGTMDEARRLGELLLAAFRTRID